MTRFALTAERVLGAGELMKGCTLVVSDGRIERIATYGEPVDAPLRDLGAGILAPGLIDLQVNGGGGVLFNETPTVEGVRKIAQAHRKFGTTGLLPTVVTDAPEVMHAAAAAVGEAIRQRVPGVLGIHIEGPFIDVKRKGAHDPRFIRKPTDEDIAWLCGLDCGKVLLTLAPNVVDVETIRRLTDAGIIVSLGHSDATAEEANAAIAAGARSFTHLFNAMSQMTGRAPGLVGAALADAGTFRGLIADGHHVHPAAMRAALLSHMGSTYLVSDAMPSAAGGPDRFTLQGRPVAVRDGDLRLADGTLAGATITLADAVRYAHRQLKIPLDRALALATTNPARALRLEREFAAISKGFPANLVHLSPDLDVLETWIDGVSAHA